MAVAYAVETSVLVDGRELEDALNAHIDQLVVDEDLHRPAMFAITLFDPQRDIVRRTGMRAGAEVEISIVGQGAKDDTSLLHGDVVTVECDYDTAGARVVIRGYAASHRLQRGRRTRTFTDATDSDIVEQVLKEAGIDAGEITPTTEVHEHVSQANQTDWEFLAGRARRLAFDLTATGGKVRFGPRRTSAEAPAEADADADPDGLDPRQLVFGYNLRAFHGRLSAADQVAKVEVRGWDEDRKQPVVALVDGGTGAAEVGSGAPTAFARAFGDLVFRDVTAPVRGEHEAENIARAIAERIGSAFAEAEGMALGNTALRAGEAVRVSRVSDDFAGAYVLSHVRHVVDREGYRTHFTIGGRHDRSLLGLVSSGVSSAPQRTSGAAEVTMGLVRGTVSDNQDPEMLGRVKVKLPWLDEAYSSGWAPVMQLGAGPSSGTFLLPAVDDEVLIGFEHGQVDRPIVIGGLFNKTDQPPNYAQYLDNGSVTGRAIVSRQGHQLAMHDARDESGITLGAVDDGGTTVVRIALDALDEKLVIRTKGAIELVADGEMTLRGSRVTVQSQGDLVLKGTTIKLN